MKHNRITLSLGIIGLAALILMLNFLSPSDIGPLGVLLFFTTVYVTIFGFITFLMESFLKIAFRREKMSNKDYLYSAVLSFGPIMFLMARSFGAISLWTTALIIIFLFLAEFLVKKRI
ncbi:hypothetical protein IKD67_00380 [Candidatus Saccharibacteria bacterium]|jgi:hypothetical protein|nr:hypothetical protein [Candidatus Saccharibacteria bacterium]